MKDIIDGFVISGGSLVAMWFCYFAGVASNPLAAIAAILSWAILTAVICL